MEDALFDAPPWHQLDRTKPVFKGIANSIAYVLMLFAHY